MNVNQEVKREITRLALSTIILGICSYLIIISAYGIAIIGAINVFSEHPLLAAVCCATLAANYNTLTYTHVQGSLKQMFYPQKHDIGISLFIPAEILTVPSSLFVMYLYITNLMAIPSSNDLVVILFYRFYILIPLFIMAIGFYVQRLSDKQYFKMMYCIQTEIENMEAQSTEKLE